MKIKVEKSNGNHEVIAMTKLRWCFEQHGNNLRNTWVGVLGLLEFQMKDSLIDLREHFKTPHEWGGWLLLLYQAGTNGNYPGGVFLVENVE